jgi:Fe-S-cluster containining protein
MPLIIMKTGYIKMLINDIFIISDKDQKTDVSIDGIVYNKRGSCFFQRGITMQRDVSIGDIWDGRFYGSNEMVHIGCHDCEGCSDCCRNTGDSIILDPLDMYCLTIWTHKTFEEMIENEIEIRMVDGMILPNIKEYDEEHPEKAEGCPFLDENGRCSIHAFRPGFCRLFPLGRYYVDEADEGEGAAVYRKDPGKLRGLQKVNGRIRGFQYFIQRGECTKQDAEKYDVKLADWLGVENLDKYEQFIVTWHFFLKDAAAGLQRFPARAQEQVARSILQIFFVQPYDRFEDFYVQFDARLANVKKSLAKLGIRL